MRDAGPFEGTAAVRILAAATDDLRRRLVQAAAVSPMLRTMASGFAPDRRGFEAGYQAGSAGERGTCPAGIDAYSFYLGREAACPGGSHKKCNQGE